MNPERWQEIDRVFQAVVELEPAHRTAFLDEACSGDPTLRGEVDALLSTDERGWHFIEGPALEAAASMLADNQPQLTVGENIARYEVVGVIGAGGMGEVYLARDQTLNRKIALKLLPADYTTDEDRLRRFQQEAQAASALNHPNILTIYELGEVDGRQFIATELVDGETLREHLKRKRVSLQEALDIASQVASALAAAHRARIIHRDIKPENIMMRPDGLVKVLDFGLAKLTSQTERPSNVEGISDLEVSSGLLMGTLKYMSPEQAQGLSVDQRSDIFSLGVVLYEMITGHTPFKGESAGETVQAILTDEPSEIQAPDDLKSLISKALAKTKQKRYQTAEDLLADLKTIRARFEPNQITRQAKRLRFDFRRWRRSNSEADAVTMQAPAYGQSTVATSAIEHLVVKLKQRKLGFTLGLIVLFVALIGIGYSLRARFKKNLTISWTTSTPVAVTGQPANSPVALSPEGNYLVYVHSVSGTTSLSVKNLATGSIDQITPSQNGSYIDVKVSPDGENVYYIWSENSPYQGDLYRVPIRGRVPATKLVDDVARSMALSPDGKRLAFWRHVGYSTQNSLYLADADGRNERELVSHDAASVFGWLAWSPNGETIACSQTTGTPVDRIKLVGVDVNTGKESLLTSRTWAGNTTVGQIAWLADGGGFITNQKDELSGPSSLWQIDYPGGQARRLTEDLTDYSSLTLSGNRLVTIKNQQFSEMWVAPNGDARQTRQITKSEAGRIGGVTWASDGRVIFVSNANGNDDIWIMDADGSNRRQLTDDPRSDFYPGIAPDSRYVVFSSDRTGRTNIWRIDLDGTNAKQLTRGSIDLFPQVSPDGRWVIYSSFTNNKMCLWRVSIDGGTPEQLTYNVTSNAPSLSPDGRSIACLVPAFKTAILPSTGGDVPLRVLSLPPNYDGQFKFSREGNGLIYLVSDGGVSNLWQRSLDNEELEQLTHFTSGHITSFDWSSNGNLVYSQGTRSTEIVLMSISQ